MAKGSWFTREYRMANGITEKTKFFVPEGGKASSASSRERKRQLRRAEKNAMEAKQEAARIVNNNFRAGRDYFVTLTLSDEGLRTLIRKAGSEDPDALLLAMRHEIKLCAKRARYAMRGVTGAELKYFAVASDIDGKTGELVRPHIHMIVNRRAARAVADAWHLGEVKRMDKLYSAHHGDLTDLVEYMLRQVRVIGNEKRYIPSRNLEPPKATAPRPAKNPDAPLRVPKGCAFIWRSEQREGYAQRLRYYRPMKGLDPEGADDGDGLE